MSHGSRHDHCEKCGWPITHEKERAHQRLIRITTETVISGLAATFVVLALKAAGI